MAHSFGLRSFGSGALAAWMLLLMGADCGGYYPYYDERDAGIASRRADAALARDAFVDRSRPVRDYGRWEVFEVDASIGATTEPQLAIDPRGPLHLTCVASESGEVLHVHGMPGLFETEIVGHQRLDPLGTSRAAQQLASDGTVHLAFSFDTRTGVTHAWRDPSGVWSSELLPFAEGPANARQPGIALFPDGTPLFVGVGPTSPQTTVEVRVFDGATNVVLGNGSGLPALRIDVAVTPDGTPHASFVTDSGETGAGVVLASRIDGVWATRTFDGVLWSHLHVDPTGLLHFAYVRTNGTSAELLDVAGGALTTADDDALLFASSEGITSPTLAVDASGTFHVVFESNRGVTYASNATGTWQVEPMEVGRDPVLALDGESAPWVAYLDLSNVLVVARRSR